LYLKHQWFIFCLIGLLNVFQQKGNFENGENKVLQHKMTGKSQGFRFIDERINKDQHHANQQARHAQGKCFKDEFFRAFITFGQYGINAPGSQCKKNGWDPEMSCAQIAAWHLAEAIREKQAANANNSKAKCIFFGIGHEEKLIFWFDEVF
jgi:hypothetical protein